MFTGVFSTSIIETYTCYGTIRNKKSMVGTNLTVKKLVFEFEFFVKNRLLGAVFGKDN